MMNVQGREADLGQRLGLHLTNLSNIYIYIYIYIYIIFINNYIHTI